jgi:hypothetical protein
MPGSRFTLGAKAGNTTQASKPIGTAASAQIPNICHKEYWAIDSRSELATSAFFIFFPPYIIVRLTIEMVVEQHPFGLDFGSKRRKTHNASSV